MFLNVKFETLTYQAGEIDFSMCPASAPNISGRSKTYSEAVPAFNMATRIWLMLSVQIMAYYAKVKALRPRAQLAAKYCAPGEPAGHLIPFTLNRRLRRRLARLQRLGRIAPAQLCIYEADDDEDDGLSETQFLDKMIRHEKWCRVRVFGLGMTRRALRKMAVMFEGLQGRTASLRRAMACHALLSPD